jgi:hypothetical protein
MQTRKPSDVDRIVAKIDETRIAEHWRNPDRPDAKFVKRRRRQDPKITRAKTRARTAVYRNRLDQPTWKPLATCLFDEPVPMAPAPALAPADDEALCEIARIPEEGP